MLIQDSLYVPGVQSFPKLRTAAVKLQGRAEAIEAAGGGNAMGKLLKAFWDDQKGRIGSANGIWHDGVYLGHGNEDIRPLAYAVQSHLRLYPNAKDKADFTSFCTDMAARGDAIGKPPVVAVAGVTISPKTLSGVVGGTGAVSAAIAPDNATNKAVTYKSSDATVASVGANGAVSYLKAGTATVTVTTEDGGKTDTCTVTVTAAPEGKNGV